MKKAFGVFISIFLLVSGSIAFSEGTLSASQEASLRQGYEAFRNEDWASAAIFLKKVVSAPGNASDENYFMLIKSEIYSGEYKQAQEDCEKFIEKFPFSVYLSYVQYQNGRLLHLLGKNEDAILALSDFCHQHYDDELYPLALYWIAEAFYDEYNFPAAKGLYQRVAYDFENCERALDAQYKLDLIDKRSREEKLLYLLKVIGEENLSTREEYERQLRIYQMEDRLGLNRELIDAQARIAELEAMLAADGSAGTGISFENAANGGTVADSSASTSSAEEKTQSASAVAEKTEDKNEPNILNTGSAAVHLVNETSLQLNKNRPGKPGFQMSSGDAQTNQNNKDVEALKRKAKQLQYLLDEQ
ncbi:MAG: tetratricopeptide repeat protein [Treponema sp.]|nr:tetratricopeptide repeat protein [Candidatus Treponema equifaecale]